MVAIATVSPVALLDTAVLAVAFGVRTAVQHTRTGDTGWRLSRPRSVPEGLARALLVGALLSFAVALLRTPDRGTRVLTVTGAIVALCAIGLVWAAQMQMGASWRIGVDPDERTALVRSGLYAHVRNPIYTGMAVFAVAHVAMAPSSWSLVGAVAVLVGTQIQVRGVEEPHLLRLHADAYRAWAATSGRFVPRPRRRRQNSGRLAGTPLRRG
jgi:protein-S-isoprenylcysteine O-methyltransferase Ste14